MEYRDLKNGYKASLLGYGCMRFPVLEDGKTVDEKEAERLLLKAYESGVTYFDTAFPYHDGQSEKVVGNVMSKLKRDTYYIATKMPTWFVKEKQDAINIFNTQLERLKTDYIDFYLLHALNKDSYNKMKELGVVDLLKEYKDKVIIKNYGFSFHDDYEAFEYIINDKDYWDFCQIQFNYVDKDTQATMKGYELAKKKGVPLIIMEPVKGGNLASVPKDVIGIMDKHRTGLSPAAWALSWVASFDNVKVILSGMSNMEQLTDNLNTFNNFKALSDAEFESMAEVERILNSRVKNGCTGCKYCMPCPVGVNIPGNFSIWNTYHKFENAGVLEQYRKMDEKERASSCVKCGRCEGLCPQKLSIRDNLASMAEEMKELLA